MKQIYFLDANNVPHAFDEDADPSFYEGKGFRSISEEEAMAIANPKEPVDVSLERVKQYMRTKRAPILDALNGIGWRAGRMKNDAVADEAVSLSQALLDITDDEGVNSAEDFEGMKSAADSAFDAIAMSASADFQAAFRDL